MKNVKILIGADKIKNRNSGLGRVTVDFTEAIVSLAPENFHLSFLLADKVDKNWFGNYPTELLNFGKRIFPFHLKKYDLFHCTYQGPSYKIKGAGKTILTIHDLNFLFTKSLNKQKKYLKRVQSNVNDADAIVFVSEFTYQICQKNLNIHKDKIVKVIYNGMKLPSCQPKRPEWYNDSAYFFSIGQFLEKKNFHVLLPMIKNMKDNSLIIAGEKDTAYGKKMEQLINEHKLIDKVVLPGPVSEEEKLFLYQNCIAFLAPSMAEGFGLPVIEAMKLGKPVFCSNQTSLTEIGGEHAFYWDDFDASYMESVVSQGLKQFTQEAKNAAIHYANQFTWEKNALEYLELYQLLLKN